MRVLAVANMFPLPADNGGAIRVLAMLEALSHEHELRVLAVQRPQTGPAAARELEERLGAPVEGFAPTTAANGAAVWARALRTGAPPWMVVRARPALAARVQEIAAAHDLVVVLDDYAGVYVDRVPPEVPVLVDKHHVFGSSLERDAPPGMSLRRRARQRMHLALVRRFERRIASRAAEVVVTSADERDRLTDLYGAGRVSVVPGAVTLRPARAAPSASLRRVGWIGSAGDPIIGEGVLRFVGEAWAPLAERGLELHLAGWDRDRRLASVADVPGVHVHGYVDDAAAFLAGLDVGIVPVWGGAGVRLKTLEMLGVPLPVVATPDGIEGLDVRDGEHCLVGTSPAGLAGHIRSLTEDPAGADRMATAGRALVAAHHTWPLVTPLFMAAVQRAARTPPAATVAP